MRLGCRIREAAEAAPRTARRRRCRVRGHVAARRCRRPHSRPLIQRLVCWVLQEDFDRAAEEAKTLPDNTTDQDKLDL